MGATGPTTASTDSSVHSPRRRSCDEGGSGRRVVLERGRDLLLGLVVAGETVNAGLDENEAELGVLVLAVGLEVLADGDSLFDEVPEVLGDLGSKT